MRLFSSMQVCGNTIQIENQSQASLKFIGKFLIGREDHRLKQLEKIKEQLIANYYKK